MVEFISTPDMLEHDFFLSVALWRDYQGNVTTDGLGCRIAEHTLRSPIPRHDYAVQGLADDGIVRRVDNRREQSGY